MKYIDKYPNIKIGQMVDATIYRHKDCDNCAECGTMTSFYDLDLKAYVCSEECDEILLNEMFRNVMKN